MAGEGRSRPRRPSTTPGGGESRRRTTPPCPSPCTITSQTVSTARRNRARTRIGVAERVRLTCSPGGSVTWSVSGGGTFSSTSGTTVTYTAPSRAATPTITARVSGRRCTIRFTVVEPNAAYQVKYGATVHHAGFCNAGFRGITYLEPRDVSFENIEINEGVCRSRATGSFRTAGWHNLRHPPWPSWASVGGGNDTTGSVVQGPNHATSCTYYDYIHSGDLPAACAAGRFRWNIPWRFRVSGGTPKTFTRLLHLAVADGSRTMTINKGGVSASATEPP